MYHGAVKLTVLSRLDDLSASNLADYLNIPTHDRRALGQGQAGRGVWDWLENRGRLGELSYALRQIDRQDLADLLDSGPQQDSGTHSGGVPVVTGPPASTRAGVWILAMVVVAVLLGVVVVGGIVLGNARKSDGIATVRTGASQPPELTVPVPSTAPTAVEPSWPASADLHPCRHETRPAAKQELGYLCPMLWDSPGVTMTTVPVFDRYQTADVTPTDAVDQLVRGQQQYFSCQVKGGRYRIGPQSGASGAEHDWWAFTEGDGNRWGFVPEVYLWGGPDYMPDPGLPTCQPGELARHGF